MFYCTYISKVLRGAREEIILNCKKNRIKKMPMERRYCPPAGVALIAPFSTIIYIRVHYLPETSLEKAALNTL